MSELTKIGALKCVVPMEKDSHESKCPEAQKWIVKQLPLRREWQHSKDNGGDMDVDCAEGRIEHETEVEGGPSAHEVWEEEGDLDTLKGGRKGAFHGHCSQCWICRHKRVDCRKRLAAERKKERQRWKEQAWKKASRRPWVDTERKLEWRLE